MITHISLKTPVWDTLVMIFIGDWKEVQTYINKNIDYELEEFTNLNDLVPRRCRGTSFELKINDHNERLTKHCMWLKQFNGTIEDFSILNHEMLHCVISALGFAGMELTDESEEAYAYTYDHLAVQIYKELEKRKLCSFRKEKK